MSPRISSLLVLVALVACLALTALAAGRNYVQGPFIVPDDAPPALAKRGTRDLTPLHIYDTVTITWEGFEGDRTMDLRITDLNNNVLEHSMIPNSGSFSFVLGRLLPGVGVSMQLTGRDTGRTGTVALEVRFPDVYKK